MIISLPRGGTPRSASANGGRTADMTPDAVHYLSLTEVSGRLRRGELKPTTLSESILARIAKYDQTLRSYTTLLADRAMAQARQAEKELDRGLWRGPLHGVPIAVKDLCYTDYAPTAAGMLIHKDFLPPHTSTVVERLERAGAIILGKLSMTEGAFAIHHPGMPTPVNPWHAEVWTGASSSGSGAATAAGLCYGSLGSDTGGSIRFPSAACGLTGLKPTWGRVSRYGIFPLSESLDHIGPIARTAADCGVLLAAISGADPRDPTALLAPVPDYVTGLTGSIRGLRVGIAQAYAFDGLHEDVLTVLTGAKDALVALGARPVPADFPSIADAMTAWLHLCFAEAAIAHEATYPSRAAEYGPALGSVLEAARKVSAGEIGRAHILRDKFIGEVGAVFQDIDVLLIPVWPMPLPSAAEWIEMAQGNIADLLRYSAPFNLTGMPALTMNGGFDRRGAPIGFQLVGKHLSEDLLLLVGHAFQSITDWHTHHPRLE
jgi:amidase